MRSDLYSPYVAFMIGTVEVDVVPAGWKTDVHLKIACQGFGEAVHFSGVSCFEKYGLIGLIGVILSSGRS